MMDTNDLTEEGLDETLELLASHRRRIVLKHVVESDGSVTVGRLAELLAAAEDDDVDPDSVSGQPRKRMYISLRQTHLDALQDAGVVVWDDETNKVSEGSEARPLANALAGFLTEWCDAETDPTPVWGRFRETFGAVD